MRSGGVMGGERRGDDGFVLAWLALFMATLMVCAGFAVDVGYWYLVANRVQGAADAAALAGVTHLPGDTAEATTAAEALSSRNGFTDGANAIVTAEQQPKPSQLKVTVSTEAPTFFASILGWDSLTITRDATAEFEGPIPMGSPVNTMGNEPIAAGETAWSSSGSNPQFWVNIAGPGTTKISGDRHQAGACASTVSGCSGSTNTEYSTDGYFFAIRVPDTASAPGNHLAIEVFDPAFVQVGDTCTANTLNNAASLDPSTPSRYGTGAANPFCSGDHQIANTTNNPVTTFIVRRPDESPWIDTDNAVIQPGNVTVDSPGATGAECGPKQYRPFNGGAGSIRTQLQTSSAFAGYFRRWVRICTTPITGPGDYLLQVRTNALVGTPLTGDPGIDTKGHNRFAIRAAVVPNASPGATPMASGISVFGNGRLPIYANAQGANTQFFLARLVPGNDGRSMRVQFFDTGDASQAGTIQILPPVDSNKAVFTGCEFRRDGASAVTSGTCTLSGVSSGAGYNGKTVDAHVPVPDGYTCNQASQSGCWVRLKFSYPAGTNVNDTTTWSAAMTGDPVRLIE